MHITQSKQALQLKKVLTKNKNASSFMLLFKDELRQLEGRRYCHRGRFGFITKATMGPSIVIEMDDNETMYRTEDVVFTVDGIKEDIICVDLDSSVYSLLKTRGNRYKWINSNTFHIVKSCATLAMVRIVTLKHRDI